MENVASALIATETLKPEVRLAQAISEFSASLRDDKDAHIRFKNLQTRSPPDATEILRLTEELNRDGARQHRSWSPLATRLVAVLERICQFAPIGDVLVGGAQNLLAAGIWAAIRLALELSLGYVSYFDKVTAMLLRIGQSLSLHQDFALLFPQCRQIQTWMCEYTVVMVDICKKVVTHVGNLKSLRSQLQTIFFTSFDSEFKPLEKSLVELGRLIEKRCVVLAASTNLNAQSSTLDRLSRFQASFTKDTAHRLRESRKNRLFTSLCSDQEGFDLTWRRERKKGTSDWILKHNDYQNWRISDTSSTLWLQGNLGSGKTVTMASIVADLVLSPKFNTADQSEPALQNTVSHYFCKADNPTTLQARNIIGSFVLQTLANSALSELLTKYLKRQKDNTGQALGSEDCIDVLLQVTTSNWRGALVLDGLDELPLKEVEEVFEHLKRLSTQRHLLLCCSSHPPSTCKDIASATVGIAATISMEHVDRSGDILKFISAGVERWKTIRPISPGLEDLITRQLLERSQGMFLWLSLQMEAICPRYTEELQSEAAIVAIVKNLPNNLSEAFDQALLRISTRHNEAKIFQIVAAAYPPLSLDELRVAFNVVPGDVAWNPSTLVAPGRSLISRFGGSLLDIDEEDYRVRFIHHSVLTHLISFRALPAAEPFHFRMPTAATLLATICITYLNYTIFETRISIAKRADFSKVPSVITHSVGQHSGLSQKVVSALSREKRTRASAIDLERLNFELQAFKDEIKDENDILLPFARANWLILSQSVTKSFDRAVQPLWAKLCSGSVPLVANHLPWLQDSSYSTAAEWAIVNNHRLLFLELIQTPSYHEAMALQETLFQLAKQPYESSPSGERRLRFCLLGAEAGVLLPAWSLYFRRQAVMFSAFTFDTILRHVELPSHAEVHFNIFSDPIAARALLNYIALYTIPKILDNFDLKNDEKSSWKNVFLRFLVENLQDMNADLRNGETILQMATERARGSNWKFVKFLIENGADSSLRSDDGFAPLHLACGEDVKTLLDAGASPNVPGVNGVTPLMLSAFRGDTIAVRDLLRAGADPNHQLGRFASHWKSVKELLGNPRKEVPGFTGSFNALNVTISHGFGGDTALAFAISRLELHYESRWNNFMVDIDPGKDWVDFETIVLAMLDSNLALEHRKSTAKRLRRYQGLHLWRTILDKFQPYYE
ncbi:hypothetical protein LY78DRAFT_663177 [Colletotrichum sublineola]|uniref:Putative NACHT domain-containing protein n=1 Tax=Colletotrichum sublineola TaxID=1173701 RepID=A0A066X8L8_COLSU|nr:hypothetical protein LY78DRAFT_663177 [Colletotrichum sublineola]KDN62081.1 putative NACHT domain-containing protein [Colletotrichum sublineola]